MPVGKRIVTKLQYEGDLYCARTSNKSPNVTIIVVNNGKFILSVPSETLYLSRLLTTLQLAKIEEPLRALNKYVGISIISQGLL